jgi:hypothetical protein
MISFTKHRVLHLLFAVSLIAGTAACGDDDTDNNNTGGSGGSAGSRAGSGGKGGSAGTSNGGKGGGGGTGGSANNEDAGVAISAADLRTTLNLLLSEHITFASKATAAALGGRMDEFTGYSDLLNDNGNDIADLVGSVYGDSAETMFKGIWGAHNGYFVDYTKGVAADDDDKKNAAVTNLTDKYVPDFSKLVAGATGLKEEDVASLTMEHVTKTKAIVDAQAAALKSKSQDDWAKAYSAIRDGFAHMKMIGDALSEAIASQHSSTFKGDPKTAAVDLRVSLNQALQEHLYLATFATGAALGGRDGEFAAASDALNANGNDIGDVIGKLYDDAAKTTFEGLWNAHNGYFVSYTKGVAAKDDDMKNAAVKNLTDKYVPDFADFLHGATDLPVDTLKTLIMDHVTMTKAVVDAQGGDKPADAAKADRTAAQHMQMIGDPLAEAIAKKKDL